MTSDKAYKDWMREVDQLCIADYHVGVEDLPDHTWRILFDDGMTPQEAFLDFVEVIMQEIESCDV